MLASLTFAAMLFVSPAPQATTDCPATYGDAICQDPALAPLRTEMADKFAAVRATGNRTATWQARQDAILRHLRRGLDYEGHPLVGEALEQVFRDHIADLDKALKQAKGVSVDIKIPSARTTTCLAKWLDQGCRATGYGILWHGKREVHWQMMDGASGDDGIGAGVILWEARGDGTAKMIGWSFDGVVHEPPRLTTDGKIWVPGRRIGSGEANADLLFVWDEKTATWQDIDLESWRDALPAKLPKGFGIWRGVEYDFEGMAASSKLWRDKDANCCASGGDALIEFDIQGRSLRLTSVRADIVEKWAPGRD